MTQLVWDAVGERVFEVGIDHAVVYLPDITVPWNGLTSISERIDDGSLPHYMEGIKYLDFEVIGNYAATVKAFTYPDEIEKCVGAGEIGNGLHIHYQPPKRFNMSYRTYTGDDVDGIDRNYQIHILYNVLLIEEPATFSTTTNQAAAIEFGWSLVATPGVYENFRPTAHVVLNPDEINPYLLEILLGMLYGTDSTDPSLPSFLELMTYIYEWDAITIVDNGDGTWTATGPDEYITMLDPTTFEITHADATYVNPDMYTITDVEL